MTHNDHCYVTNRSNLQFAAHFRNVLTEGEAHTDSAEAEQYGKMIDGHGATVWTLVHSN